MHCTSLLVFVAVCCSSEDEPHNVFIRWRHYVNVGLMLSRNSDSVKCIKVPVFFLKGEVWSVGPSKPVCSPFLTLFSHSGCVTCQFCAFIPPLSPSNTSVHWPHRLCQTQQIIEQAVCAFVQPPFLRSSIRLHSNAARSLESQIRFSAL